MANNADDNNNDDYDIDIYNFSRSYDVTLV